MNHFSLVLSVVAILISLTATFDRDNKEQMKSPEVPRVIQSNPISYDKEIALLSEQIAQLSHEIIKLQSYEVMPETKAEATPQELERRNDAIATQAIEPTYYHQNEAYDSINDLSEEGFAASAEDTIRETALQSSLQNGIAAASIDAYALKSVQCREIGCRIEFDANYEINEHKILELLASLDTPVLEYSLPPPNDSQHSGAVVFLK